jgi:pyruvate dehydrogenase E2 component (dihydrolipoamide acetyltransferase)
MPSMGMYTEEGVLTAWLRAPGTRVSAGEPVAEITTEKATFEIPAPEEGTLHAVAAIGSTLKVEAVMGYILQLGETAPSSGSGASAVPGPVTPANRVAHSAGPPPEGPLRASPIAKRMALQHGIDLREVKGSGPSGRIVEADIQALIQKGQPAGQKPLSNQVTSERVPMAGLRRSLAQRLRNTLATAASTTLTREADAELLVAARKNLSQQLGKPPSYDSLFVKILADSLSERPELNAVLEGDSILRLKEINVGFAVAVPNGLIVPVVRNADTTPFASLVSYVKDLTERVLAGRLLPADVEGGTATISNLGGHGIDAFTPILNGSQSVILGIGRIVQRPVVRNSAVAIGHTCVLSLTFDHRVTDGAPAAMLLEAIVKRMTDERFLADLAK